MSRIERRIAQRRSHGQTVSVVFVTAGDPSLEATREIVLAMDKVGIDIVELGIPFSDPIADGPSIQASSQRALSQGVTPTDVLELVSSIRSKSDIPIVLMSYYNPVLQMGLEAFSRVCSFVGVDGVILTDLSPEEAGPWKRCAAASGIDTIFLVAPTSTDERIALISKLASGFIYCVSRTGVTGARDDLAKSELQHLIQRVRAHTRPQGFSANQHSQTERQDSLPVIVGFGISRPEHVRAIADFADGAVVGSALVDFIAQNRSDPNLPSKVALRAAQIFGLAAPPNP